MDNRPTNTQLLDLIAAPCFCVRDGRILACNAGAKGLLLQPGMPIETLLNTAREEYALRPGGESRSGVAGKGIREFVGCL